MFETKLGEAFLGTLVADAVAMPVHWYYDREAMDRDYGDFNGYRAPRNPHPDSLLVKSAYEAPNEKGEILHHHSQYWGQAGIHYHQELEAGDNTLTYRLALELFRMVVQDGGYDPDKWLDRYISLMRQPGWNRDTYLEECHRAFFINYARGKSPRECAIDDHHIAGLAQIPALIAALAKVGEDGVDLMRSKAQMHIELTHQNRAVVESGDLLVRLLHRIASGDELDCALEQEGNKQIAVDQLDQLAHLDERVVVGQMISPACYIGESFPAGLFLAWKFREDFSGGVIANARVGGDNCHRGAVVGSLLAAANGIPDLWWNEKISPALLKSP